jgi:hypothetical protein
MPDEKPNIFTPPANPPVNPSPAAPVRVKAGDPSPGAPTVSSPALSAPQERWAADRAAVAAKDPWQQDPAKVAMIKDPITGEITAKARDGSTGDPANPGDPGQATVEGGKLRIGELELSESDIRQIMTETAAREARRATMPATAADYNLDLPADFKMPDGQSWHWNLSDPVLGPTIGLAKEFAHSVGLDQAAFSRMMALYASTQLHEGQLIAKARAAEVAKLGANAPIRVDAVNTFLRGHLGDDKARAITSGLHTAKQIEAFETLMQRFTNQGGGSYSGAHREVAKMTVSEEAYAKMSYSEKKAYAEAASQHEQATRR